jgi:hypothetical protein
MALAGDKRLGGEDLTYCAIHLCALRNLSLMLLGTRCLPTCTSGFKQPIPRPRHWNSSRLAWLSVNCTRILSVLLFSGSVSARKTSNYACQPTRHALLTRLFLTSRRFSYRCCANVLSPCQAFPAVSVFNLYKQLSLLSSVITTVTLQMTRTEFEDLTAPVYERMLVPVHTVGPMCITLSRLVSNPLDFP